MPQEDLHYPPGAEPKPAPEPEPAAPAPEPAPEPETPPTPEPKPEEEPENDPSEPEPSPLPKKRSIYDDYKDKKQEAKEYRDVAIAALKAQGVELTGKETPAELQGLMQKHKTPDAPTPPAPTPPAPSQPTDELEAYAKENNLDPAALSRLAEIIAKRVPAAQLPEAERKELADLKAWQASKQAEEQRTAEDNEIRGQAPEVKKQLEIHDDAELQKVMEAIVKLAHTERYHDKEVDYIVFREREALSKLVSPKKPSFEHGGQHDGADPEPEVEFSGKMSPQQAQKAVERSFPKSTYEVRRQK